MSCRGFELFSQINIHPVQQNGFSNMAHSEKRISKYDMIVLDYHGVGHEPNTKKKSWEEYKREAMKRSKTYIAGKYCTHC